MEDQVINTFILIDDFCKHLALDSSFYGLPGKSSKPKRKPEMYLSEMLTIVVHFHQSGCREFKDYYLEIVSGFLRSYFHVSFVLPFMLPGFGYPQTPMVFWVVGCRRPGLRLGL